MTTYNVLEAKSNLSRLIEAVESGRETEIIAVPVTAYQLRSYL